MKFGTMRLEIARNPGYYLRQLISFEGRYRADRQSDWEVASSTMLPAPLCLLI